MSMRRVAFAATMVATLVGCGAAVHTPATVPPAPPPAAAGPASALQHVGGGPILDFSRPWIHSPAVICDGPSYRGTLTLDGLLRGVPTAGIVTLDARSTPRWNTSDGHRWTEAEAQAAMAQGIRPWLFTPWTLHRSGPVFRGSLPPGMTAFVSGGTLGQDEVRSCGTGHPPVVGGTFLAEFSTETATGMPGIYALMPYDPATRTVQTPYGLLTLAPSTSG